MPMTSTETPALVHFESCDDLALGRLVRAAFARNTNANTVGAAAVQALNGWRTSEVDWHRGTCDCARLRVTAIDTQIARLRRIQSAAAERGEVVAGVRSDLAVLAQKKTAIRDAELRRLAL